MKIVGVTSCSTGIAHTYMAAEAIVKAAEKLGHTAKIETQGSIGIENKLTRQEIEEADIVIMADDAGLSEPDRFEGIKKCKIKTVEFIKDRDKALQKCIDYFVE